MTTVETVFCDCGEELGVRDRVRCKTCRIIADAGSSQCPFCLEWYYTHRGLGSDKEQMAHHAAGRCLRG